MFLAFDAKRAFHNRTGLGNYSRTLLESLARYYPSHTYYLCNPKPSSFYTPPFPSMQEVRPQRWLDRTLSSLWRSKTVVRDLRKLGIDCYHGLSHEIPFGINKTGIRTLVTMHDLIYERYPHQYNPVDVRIYRKKYKYACKHADRIIAISEQTKKDVVEIYGIPAEKIAVCHLSCDSRFERMASAAEKDRVRREYGLPDQFLLYVGSIIERKNLLNICKALFLLRDEIKTPLIVIGNGGKYKEQVKSYILQNSLQDRIIFLNESPAYNNPRFNDDLPLIYQLANALVFPSMFEGFGIPLLEALWSGLPVITASVSSLPEVTGDAAIYIDPMRADELAEAIRRVLKEPGLADTLIKKGKLRALQFTTEKTAAAVMKQYNNLKNTPATL
jgi:glycosyltransferase involved in cell wall biosynthesis